MNKSTSYWTDEFKFLLVNFVKENIIVLYDEATEDILAQKENAWQKIHKALINNGLPIKPISSVKRMWTSMKTVTIERYKKYNQQVTRKSLKVEEPSELHKAIFKLLQHAKHIEAFWIGRKQVPKPIAFLKKEPMDTTENAALPIENGVRLENIADYNKYNPVVLLENIRINKVPKIQVTSTTTVRSPNQAANAIKTEELDEREKVKSEILENELKIKQVQRQQLDEQIEFERVIYNKRLVLLDLEIQKKKLEIESIINNCET